MKTLILNKEEIVKVLDVNELIPVIEKSFVDFSQGRVIMPAPQDIIFPEFKGETHVKSAYIRGGKYYCIKIASGFYNNPQIGLSSSQGLMILCEARTGIPRCILLDEGELTNYRTAAAGAVAAKYLAQKNSKRVAVVGTGIQAKLQVELLTKVFPIAHLFIWSRDQKKSEEYISTMKSRFPKIDMKVLKDLEEIIHVDPDIIITTTPSRSSLIMGHMVKRGVHINAIGADMPGKQEIDPEILKHAKIITDSTEQCAKNGELQHVSRKFAYAELGEIIAHTKKGRENDKEITLFDATGLGVQDLAIAQYIVEKYLLEI